jgi:hypothetical protein
MGERSDWYAQDFLVTQFRIRPDMAGAPRTTGGGR